MKAHAVPMQRSLLCRLGWHRWVTVAGPYRYVSYRELCTRPGCGARSWVTWDMFGWDREKEKPFMKDELDSASIAQALRGDARKYHPFRSRLWAVTKVVFWVALAIGFVAWGMR